MQASTNITLNHSTYLTLYKISIEMNNIPSVPYACLLIEFKYGGNLFITEQSLLSNSLITI